MFGYIICCFVSGFIAMVVIALISAGKYDDQQKYYLKEKKKWEEENQKLKRKLEKFTMLQWQTEQIEKNLSRPEGINHK
ncbi:MAG: hypothetical protein ACLTXM_16205 [Enterococcus sp.]